MTLRIEQLLVPETAKRQFSHLRQHWLELAPSVNGIATRDYFVRHQDGKTPAKHPALPPQTLAEREPPGVRVRVTFASPALKPQFPVEPARLATPSVVTLASHAHTRHNAVPPPRNQLQEFGLSPRRRTLPPNLPVPHKQRR